MTRWAKAWPVWGQPPARLRAASGLHRAAWTLLALSCSLASGGAATLAPTSALGAARQAPSAEAQEAPPGAQVLRDVHDLPWRLQAGVFAHAADVTAAPDGTMWVLDRRQRALHRLSMLAAPRGVDALPREALGDEWEPRRIDAGPDGLYLLAVSANASRVLRLTPSDEPGRLHTILELPLRYTDVAAHPAGGFLLSRTLGRDGATPVPRDPRPAARGGVDRFGADGGLLGSLPDQALAQVVAVDAAADGRVFAINRVPVPEPPPGTEAPATQEPSWRPAARTQVTEPQNGVVRFGADGRYLDTVPYLGLEDVAAGLAHTYLARQAEVLRLGDQEALWTGPTPRVQLASAGATILRLAQPWRGAGRLLASLNHCHAQGLLVWDLERPQLAPRLVGGLDHPPLEGPLVPLRLAAAPAGPLVLQGRSWLRGGPFGEDLMTGQTAWRPQSVQRWTWQGELRDQVGVCGGLDLPWYSDLSDAGWSVDLAADGAQLYLMQRNAVEARDGPGFPLWTFRPEPPSDGRVEASRFTAVAAAGGRLALVDAGQGRLLRLDAGGRLLGPMAWPEGLAPPVDIAWDGEDLLLAHAAPPRLVRLDGAGRTLSEQPLPDLPRALAVDGDGTAWLLGSGGRLLRLARDGSLLAAFASPQGPNTVDVAAGPGGSVWLTYLRLGEEDGEGSAVLAAGLLELRPPTSGLRLTQAGTDCWIWLDKTALPRTLVLGQTAEVRLVQGGACRPRPAPRRRVLLVDASRSMAWESSLERARGAVLALLDRLQPQSDGPLSLHAFTDQLRQLAPAGAPTSEVRTALSQLEPSGDTLLGAALVDLAAQLAAQDGAASLPVDVLAFTDGELKDDLRPGLDALKGLNRVRLRLILVPRASHDTATTVNLERLLATMGSVETLPPPQAMPAWLDQMLDYAAPVHWATEAVVRDQLPANMALVPGSLQPPGEADAGAGRLRWSLPPQVQGQESALRFTVRPTERGDWPANAAASLDLVDGWGRPRALDYPLPWIRVLGRTDLDQRAYLPAVDLRACARSAELDLVLLLDASESMGTPDGPGGRRRIDVAAEAAAGLATEGLDPDLDRIALVTFNREARLAADLAAGREVWTRALGAVALAPGTRVDRGLGVAAQALQAARPGVEQAVMLISDGRQSELPELAVEGAASLRAAGVRLVALGLGEDVDAGFLRGLLASDGDYLPAPRIAELPALLLRAGEHLRCGRRH